MAAHDRGCLSILGARQRDLLRVGDQSGSGPPAAPCPSGARRLVGLVALMLEGRCATLLLTFGLIDCLSPITGVVSHSRFRFFHMASGSNAARAALGVRSGSIRRERLRLNGMDAPFSKTTFLNRHANRSAFSHRCAQGAVAVERRCDAISTAGDCEDLRRLDTQV
jgi:hypothetical protein